MINGDRNKKLNKITRQIRYCRDCLNIIESEIDANAKEQDEDPYDKWHYIRNHTRYANDVIYLRRQLLKLEKMLREG